MRYIITSFIVLFVFVGQSIASMTPDQEIFNNIVWYSDVLASNPDCAEEIRDDLRAFDTLNIAKETVSLMDALRIKCSEMMKLERGIEYLITDGDNAIADRALSDGMVGGLRAASAVGAVDDAYGDSEFEPMVYLAAGLIGGIANHVAESDKLRKEVERAIVEEREKQAGIIRKFSKDISEYRRTKVYQGFDSKLLFDSRLLGYIAGVSPERYIDAIRRHDLLKYRVYLLNVSIVEYVVKNIPVPEWFDIAREFKNEWPLYRDKNNGTYGWLLDCLSCASFYQGNFDEVIGYATDSLFINPDNAYAFNKRAIAYMRMGQPREAILDNIRAISLEPQNWEHQYSAARIYAVGTHDRTRALDSINKAFALGFSDIKLLRENPEFAIMKSYAPFVEATTVNYDWKVVNGIFFSDVYLANNSPFPLTNVRLISAASGWEPDLTTEIIQPGETYHWSWVTQPPAGAKLSATLYCEQNP